MFEGSWTSIYFGVFSSTLSAMLLLLVFHYIVSAKLTFSKNIRVFIGKKRKRRSYSLKLKQRGMIDLIDVSITCRLAVFDIRQNGGSLWNFFDVPTTFSDPLSMKSGERIVHLKLHESSIADLSTNLAIKRYVSVRYPDAGLRLEDFFMAYPNVYLQVFVLGHDRFTGTKKLYTSQKYHFHSLRRGKWEKGELELRRRKTW